MEQNLNPRRQGIVSYAAGPAGRNAAAKTQRGVEPRTLVPHRFIVEEPECANKLLPALGIENVHVLTRLTANGSGHDGGMSYRTGDGSD